MKICTGNSKHSIWAHSKHAINADSFSSCPHALSLSDIPSPWKGNCLLQRQDGLALITIATVIKFFSSLLIHLVFNPQNLEYEGKAQRTEPRQRKDVSKDWPVWKHCWLDSHLRNSLMLACNFAARCVSSHLL